MACSWIELYLVLRTAKLFTLNSVIQPTHSHIADAKLHYNHSCPGAHRQNQGCWALGPPDLLTTTSRKSQWSVFPKDTITEINRVGDGTSNLPLEPQLPTPTWKTFVNLGKLGKEKKTQLQEGKGAKWTVAMFHIYLLSLLSSCCTVPLLFVFLTPVGQFLFLVLLTVLFGYKIFFPVQQFLFMVNKTLFDLTGLPSTTTIVWVHYSIYFGCCVCSNVG